ncbi:hypothetical protein [Chroococcus sp. FPU101]|uniref:hypothetical protein n=1 Tax=Chroococcus sp. FPU101 TaxID=1974212 RepID=UPI001A8FA10B|nr:hypothetical protein [Chroococcus sp. FPU101]GFE68996.1 hypothetical protein CFPU101_16060 [Chroococcus sp. FPU101]
MNTVNLMTLCFNKETEQQRMAFYVAQEVLGRRLKKQYRAEDKKFDWKAFKTEFQKQFGELSYSELVKLILDNVMWVRDENHIRELYYYYLKQARENQQKQQSDTTVFNFALK